MAILGVGLLVVVIVIAVGGLWVGARAFVDAVVAIARRGGLSELTIGLTIVAIGTSTPELIVSIDAALAGLGDVAVGNIVGSNIYNLAFILGIVSLLQVIPSAPWSVATALPSCWPRSSVPRWCSIGC